MSRLFVAVLSCALGVSMVSGVVHAADNSKKGVQGTIVQIEKDGSYKVAVGEGVEILSSSPVGIGGNPSDFEVSVTGDEGVLEIEGTYLVTRRPALIGANNFATYLKAKKAGKVKVKAGIKGKEKSIQIELEVE